LLEIISFPVVLFCPEVACKQILANLNIFSGWVEVQARGYYKKKKKKKKEEKKESVGDGGIK
jgi:hypothetical protein